MLGSSRAADESAIPTSGRSLGEDAKSVGGGWPPCDSKEATYQDVELGIRGSHGVAPGGNPRETELRAGSSPIHHHARPGGGTGIKEANRGYPDVDTVLPDIRGSDGYEVPVGYSGHGGLYAGYHQGPARV